MRGVFNTSGVAGPVLVPSGWNKARGELLSGMQQLCAAAALPQRLGSELSMMNIPV